MFNQKKRISTKNFSNFRPTKDKWDLLLIYIKINVEKIGDSL